MVVLPAPDGDDSTNIKPRRPTIFIDLNGAALAAVFMVLIPLGFAFQPDDIV